MMAPVFERLTGHYPVQQHRPPRLLSQLTGSAPLAWRSRNQHWHVLEVLLVGGLVAPALDAAAFEGW